MGVRWILGVGGAFAAGCSGGCTAAASEESEISGSQIAPVDQETADSGAEDSASRLDVGAEGSPPCDQCSADLRRVLNCGGQTVAECGPDEGCDPESATCIDACEAAARASGSLGCEFYATWMESYGREDRCFAAFVANSWDSAARLSVEYDGAGLDVESFAYHPVGTGPGLTYEPYRDSVGLAPGEVAILFLAGPSGTGPAACPRPSAVPSGSMVFGTGVGASFRIETDRPVAAYEFNPYGAAEAGTAGASLLLPTSAWGNNYVLINAFPESATSSGQPSANIIAAEPDTTVTIEPFADVAGGGGIPPSPAGVPFDVVLDAGEQLQLTQPGELTGSIVLADRPVGLMAGHTCLNVPVGVSYCDHAEQMVPPVAALGHEYVAVMHKPRAEEPSFWRAFGAVDGTVLTYSRDVGGPPTLDRGDAIDFVTAEPFVVRSQDEDHPFLLANLMSGSAWAPDGGESAFFSSGDPDFVLSVPPQQYGERYVFFADPTYPETSIVLVRQRRDATFRDVELGCAGTVGGWQPVGDYEWTRVDLSTGNFEPVGGCSTGRHEVSSEAPFGLWVWGWGTPETNRSNVSYGYPGGMNLFRINEVAIVPVR